MCIAVLAEKPLVVELLLESFHPFRNKQSGLIEFEQAYDLLIKNVSADRIHRIFFAHPRNVLDAQTSGRGNQLLQAREWLGKRMFREPPRIDSTAGIIDFTIYYRGDKPRNIEATLVNQGRTKRGRRQNSYDVKLHDDNVTVYDGILPTYNTNGSGFSSLTDGKGLPTFFEVRLDNPLEPGVRSFFSLSFPRQYVKPVIQEKLNIPGTSNAYFSKDTFALFSPRCVRERFRTVLENELHSSSRSNDVQQAAQDLWNDVEMPMGNFHLARIDELRIGIITGEFEVGSAEDNSAIDVCTLSDAQTVGEIDFWEIRQLDQRVCPPPNSLHAHIWRANKDVHLADFVIYFSVNSFPAS